MGDLAMVVKKEVKPDVDLDELLNASLGKLKQAESNAASASKTPSKPVTDVAKNKDEALETEVDKMLSEFAKLLPNEAVKETDLDGETGKPKPSSAKIEDIFHNLLNEPMDPNMAQDFDVGNLEEMNKVIEQMMGELTSKEVLYEPFSELVDKLPGWLELNEGKEDAKTVENYRNQLRISQTVITLFDRADYAERKAEYQKEIFEQMQLLQELGPPPEGLLSEDGEKGFGSGTNPAVPEPELPKCNQM